MFVFSELLQDVMVRHGIKQYARTYARTHVKDFFEMLHFEE